MDWSVEEAVAQAVAHPEWTALSSDPGATRAQALEWATQGSTALVEPSNAFLDALEGVLPETGRARWTHDIAGSFPNVPRYLAGSDPRVMRRKHQFLEDRAPIRIYVEMQASQGINPPTYIKRGAGVLALLRAAERVRPVELYAVLLSTNHIEINVLTIRLPSAPLNVSLVAGWLSHPGVYRQLFVRRAYQNWYFPSLLSIGNAFKARTALDLGPHDLYIPGIHLGDKVLSDPVDWIKDRLAEISHEE